MKKDAGIAELDNQVNYVPLWWTKWVLLVYVTFLGVGKDEKTNRGGTEIQSRLLKSLKTPSVKNY